MDFYKYQGCGNDFVILDGTKNKIHLSESQIKFCCDRRFGVGGDGLMILEKLDDFDFEMLYFNSDGKPSTFCGNGGRCIVQFAHDIGMVGNSARFLFQGVSYRATINDTMVSLSMRDVYAIQTTDTDYILDTGSPHYVHFCEDVSDFDLLPYARKIRYSTMFPEGINVNIAHKKSDHAISMRTYERGVEDETYSCGTGVVAASIAFHLREKLQTNSIEVESKGGHFSVEFKASEGNYSSIILHGPAQFVFKGEIIL